MGGGVVSDGAVALSALCNAASENSMKVKAIAFRVAVRPIRNAALILKGIRLSVKWHMIRLAAINVVVRGVPLELPSPGHYKFSSMYIKLVGIKKRLFLPLPRHDLPELCHNDRRLRRA
jgi:hypothetical protein